MPSGSGVPALLSQDTSPQVGMSPPQETVVRAIAVSSATMPNRFESFMGKSLSWGSNSSSARREKVGAVRGLADSVRPFALDVTNLTSELASDQSISTDLARSMAKDCK
jgi:hypothetical protein